MRLPDVTDAQRLALRPGDRLVIRVADRLSRADASALMSAVRAWAGPDVPILILHNGTVLDVVSDLPAEISRAAD